MRRARMHRLNWNLRKETQRGGAAGLRGRSRAVCRAGAHASALGRWRTEPEVSTRALLGSAGGEVAASGHKRLSIDDRREGFSKEGFRFLASQASRLILHGQISENRSPTASRQFF